MRKIILASVVVLSSAAYAQVKPVEKNGKYSFSSKGMYFEVDPKVGGRISSFKIADKEILFTDTSKGNNNWGSTFWPAPQSVWGWPPSDTLDKLPYKATVIGNTLTVNSLPTKGKTNCAFEKTFELNELEQSVSVTYKISNTTDKDISLGPWQITRVPSGGLTFFPTGTTASTGMLLPLLKTENGISWFDYDSAFVAKDQNAVPKLFSDGAKGWLAHVTNDKYLLLFKFTDTPANQKSPGEDEIELYTNPNNTYTELEPLGAFAKIAPNASTSWTVKWYVKKLPSNIDTKIGSLSLMTFVKNLVK